MVTLGPGSESGIISLRLVTTSLYTSHGVYSSPRDSVYLTRHPATTPCARFKFLGRAGRIFGHFFIKVFFPFGKCLFIDYSASCEFGL